MTQVLEAVLLLQICHQWKTPVVALDESQHPNIKCCRSGGFFGIWSPKTKIWGHLYTCLLSLVIFRYALGKKTYIFSEGMFRIMIYYIFHITKTHSSPSALHPKKLLPVTMSCLWPPVYSRVTVKAVGSWFCEPWKHACRGSTTRGTSSSSRLRQGK